MPPKPHRVLLDRVSGYADEAAAYMRRRRHLRKPFVRLYYPGGGAEAIGAETEQGKALFLAAARLIDVAGPARPEARLARAGATRSRRGAPGDPAAAESGQGGSGPEGPAPDESAPGESAPESPDPESADPESAAPGESAPGESAPGS